MGRRKKSDINKFRSFQNIALTKFINALLYTPNHTLYSDKKLKIIHDKDKCFYNRFNIICLSSHLNPLIKNPSSLPIPGSPSRSRNANCVGIIYKS